MEKTFTFDAIMALPSRHRGRLMNKVSGLKPANLIGTQSKAGETNLAIFNSVVHIGANPPYIGFILRPTTVARHTYENIMETGVFTINQVTEGMHKQAHQTSAKYAKGVSEFGAVGLIPYLHEDFKAPFVYESPIKIGLSFVEEQLIKVNDTRLIIGKVEHLILPEDVLLEGGHIALERLGSVAIGGLDSYYSVDKLGRYGYAEPE